jgi:hyperosmotically inducible protein
MNVKSTSCLLVGGIFIGALAGCATDRSDSAARHQTVTERVDDGWITTKIKSDFAVDKLVSATNIHVNTDNGVVHLSGIAKNQDEVNRAIQIARSVNGVRSVRNEMQVQGVGATR